MTTLPSLAFPNYRFALTLPTHSGYNVSALFYLHCPNVRPDSQGSAAAWPSGMAPLRNESTSSPGVQHRFLDLVSGRRRGPWPGLLRLGLRAASLPYGLAVRLRNLAYDRGWKSSHRTGVPVVCVGNLTTGGTGKTPCVEFVAGFYRGHELAVAILSRGYGSEQGVNDEALVLEENLPDVPHLQGADRVELARIALEELESELLVLDDGFQHRRLARDLDLVLIDVTCPWGYGYLLPRGLLREPLTGLRRAHAVVLTRCDQVTTEELKAIRERVTRIAPTLPIAETIHKPDALINSDGQSESLDLLKGQSVAAFCGIGNPEAFRRTLLDLEANVVHFRTYADHHPYGRGDVEDLSALARSLPAGTLLITTQKDLVKLRINQLGERPLYALRIRLAFQAGQDALETLLAQLVPPASFKEE